MKNWDKVPKLPASKYSEAECSKALRALMGPICDDIYSHEVGILWSSDGRPRPGGTRTTPGFPDHTFYMRDPVHTTLTVEAKGHSTAIKAAQWSYCLHRMNRGDAHLIVRSPESLLNGLRFLGLLPLAWQGQPPYVPDPRGLPDNLAFLEAMRLKLWQRLGYVFLLDMEMPRYATEYKPAWNSRRTLVTPSDVPVLEAAEYAAKARKRLRK